MKKRTFLRGAASIAAVALVDSIEARAPAASGPVLLTVSGAVTRPNRGAVDDALDQLMHKHGVKFRRARTFTYAELAALPSVTIHPTLEYDAKPHTLRGPRLTSLLDVAGSLRHAETAITLRAFDGYTVDLTLGEIERRGFIIATSLDGAPLALGGLGPLWAVYDADRIPEFAAKPLPARYVHCPWGLYSVHVHEPGA